ncbi:hypothetical protein CFP56_039983 [Quercus suber]|uniref:Uncharacterized protein n=1 Tax=Quercus suber TaxID=58331 RepID=A0AAW0IZ58_QUESU
MQVFSCQLSTFPSYSIFTFQLGEELKFVSVGNMFRQQTIQPRVSVYD